nr:outer membrane lipoprotein carrier protein LolA [Aliikangiella sp. G2MR2-5]
MIQNSKESSLFQFTQEKQIKFLSKPLISQGELLQTDTGELVWQTQKPIKTTLVLTRERVKQFDSLDKSVDLPGASIVKNLSNTFLSLLSGDFSRLKIDFHSTVSCKASKYSLELIPKNSELKALFSNIKVSGQLSVETVVIEEARGDLTTIHLTKFSSSTSSLLDRYLDN